MSKYNVRASVAALAVLALSPTIGYAHDTGGLEKQVRCLTKFVEEQTECIESAIKSSAQTPDPLMRNHPLSFYPGQTRQLMACILNAGEDYALCQGSVKK
jgi:hypothetical protein